MPSLQKHFKCNSFIGKGTGQIQACPWRYYTLWVVILMYSEFASSVSSLYVQAQTHGGQLIKVAGQKGWI